MTRFVVDSSGVLHLASAGIEVAAEHELLKLTNAQLWVPDQDEALAFYRDKLGMEVRADVTLPEMGASGG